MIRQSSHGKLFIPVEVTESFLGLDKGTVLKFDQGSGKYINVEGEEEIGDGEYYYSGHAIAIDPYLVQDNTPAYFRPYIKEVVEEEPVVPAGMGTTKEQFTLAPGSPVPEYDEEHIIGQEPVEKEILMEGTDFIVPTEGVYKTPEGILMFSCGLCQHENFIHKIKHGLFFPVSDKTKLVLNCENCGIETTVFYEIEGNESGKENE